MIIIETYDVITLISTKFVDNNIYEPNCYHSARDTHIEDTDE